MNSDNRPKLLVLSFSEIENDARVKKQVNLFATQYRVTSCGFGGQIRSDAEHIELQDTQSQFSKYLDAVLVRLGMYRLAQRIHPRTRAARKALKNHTFDAVIANDTDTLGVAFAISQPGRVHADLHEYFPGLHDELASWVKVRQPQQRWLLKNFARRAGSATTVSADIAARYTKEFGFACDTVHNATPFQELTPGTVSNPIRIVHSGVASSDRRIEVMMEAVAKVENNVTLDLFLTGAESEYGESLRELAGRCGPRVTMHPPVPYTDLLSTLNSYDVGIFVLPPTNTNYSLALPNKFFDFVQARLGLLVSPTGGMTSILQENELGALTDGYEVSDTVRALNMLTPEKVSIWKQHSDDVAYELSAESQNSVWQRLIAERIA